MLYLIRDFADAFFELLKEDPVRPHIPHQSRIGQNRDIFVDREQDSANAITCVSYQSNIPAAESDLFLTERDPSVAIFYTIWSYKAGKGRQLIIDSVKYIQEHKQSVKRFVTLSPKTEMARRFHLNNGAVILRENPDTINYEYVIK